MLKRARLYPCFVLAAVTICLILLSNCGGGGNSTIVPSSGITSTPNSVTYIDVTPTPVLTSKPVSGYIYGNNITTEDGETVPCINVLDVPAYQADSSGNEPFVTQVSNSLQQDYPEEWATSEMQELYAQLNKTLSESKPLPEYNAQAQLCSAYDDTSIPVGNDGHFDNTVLTGATDSNVKLEVALGEDNYTEVETLPSSGNINSSDATSTAVLKSCPEKIFAFPGEIVIFKVYSEPGINLKSAGLKFALNNPSIGCITQPVYLCLFGAHKYEVAYGCVYIKHGLDTPVDTTITAKLNSGQSMSIFLEVIKKTASVSGTVYTGGSTLVKGYVKSLGPKACCKIDSSGQYSLPKVFRGHSRSVIATWWTSENGQKIRHREEKVIDFLSGDVTGFNFGVPPTPTPTPAITPRSVHDIFYDARVSDVIRQKYQWINQYGREQAIQMTLSWLNNSFPSGPPIPKEIIGAQKDSNNNIEIYFEGGHKVWLGDQDDSNIKSGNVIRNTQYSLQNKDISYKKEAILIANAAKTVRSNKILILSPFAWSFSPDHYTTERVYGDLANYLNNLKDPDTGKPIYDVHCVVTKRDDFIKLLPHKETNPDTGQEILVVPYKENSSGSIWNPNIVRPSDFEVNNTDKNYGVIYIDTHGTNTLLDYEEDPNNFSPTRDWLDSSAHKGWWKYWYNPISYSPPPGYDPNQQYCEKRITLTDEFFQHQDYSNSIVFVSGCFSGEEHNRGLFTASQPAIYIGANKSVNPPWGDIAPFKFFCFMLFGKDHIPGTDEETISMTAKEAMDKLIGTGCNPDPNDPNHCAFNIYPENVETEIYFPAPIEIVVHKN